MRKFFQDVATMPLPITNIKGQGQGWILYCTHWDAGSYGNDDQAHDVCINVKNTSHPADQGYHTKAEDGNPDHGHEETNQKPLPARNKKIYVLYIFEEMDEGQTMTAVQHCIRGGGFHHYIYYACTSLFAIKYFQSVRIFKLSLIPVLCRTRLSFSPSFSDENESLQDVT